MDMIRIEHLVKQYPNNPNLVVNDLNLTVEKGEICVLIGTSGCGKTTTMRMINRLIPITDGHIFVDGKDIMEQNPIELRRNIGYAIQETGLFPHWSIEKNIATVPMEKKWPQDKINARVQELMELVELNPAYGKKKPSALSGGQKQRAGVARALAGDPPVMLMDEPFGALDPITRNKLQNEFLNNIQAKLKKTIVFVTHDMDEAVKMGDKIAVMQNGKLAQFGTPHEILSNPASEFVENLVGQNRIIKRFTLLRVNEIENSWPVVCFDDVKGIIDSTAKAPFVGIVNKEGHPLGFIETAGKTITSSADVEQAIIQVKTSVSGEDSLYDAMSAMFTANQKVVFSVDAAHKATKLIGMDQLFDKGNSRGK